MMLRNLQIAALAWLMALPVATASWATQTVPHEAYYKVTVEKLKIPGEILSANGEMAMSVSRDCQKWTVQHETKFQAGFSGGRRFDIESTYRIHEALDGARLDFRAITKVNGVVVVNTKGSARIFADGTRGEVEFRLPENRLVELPPDTGFPLWLANRSIDLLKAGNKINRYVLFDGVGIYHVTDVAAGEAMLLSTRPDGDVDLLAARSWRIESTLFPYGVIDSEPAGTVVTQTQENGIASGFMADYGELIARGELKSIRRLPDPDC